MKRRNEKMEKKNVTFSERVKAVNILQAMSKSVGHDEMSDLLDKYVAHAASDFLAENFSGISQGQMVVVAAVFNLYLKTLENSFNEDLTKMYEDKKKMVHEIIELTSIQVSATLDEMLKKNVDDFMKEFEDEETSKNS